MKELISVILLTSLSIYSVTFSPLAVSISWALADTETSDTPLMSADMPIDIKKEVTEQNTPSSELVQPAPADETISEPVVQVIPAIPAPSVFGLKGCRQTQSEDSHQTEKGGHSYALDLACVRGVSYDVPAPFFKDFYVIEKIDFEARLGNYLILKHWDERYVYGHTQTSRKEGDRVNAWDIIGQSNNSGHSFGVHSHVEKWLWKQNTTFDGKKINEYSQKLCDQRQWNFCKEINHIVESNEKVDLDKLAKAVARAETGGCKKWSWLSHNNCFGIMTWDDNGKRSFKRYASTEESFADFKRIWWSYYKVFPTLSLAKKWTGSDNAERWLGHVTQFYNS